MGKKEKERALTGKAFVLDTNVLIHDHNSMFEFEDNHVIIPITVIEELDKQKKGHGETAYSVRRAIKEIEELSSIGDISKGVRFKKSEGMLTVVTVPRIENSDFDPDKKIIETALEIKRRYPNLQVVFVSKDSNARIRARTAGLKAEDYKHDKTSIFKQRGGIILDDNTNGISSVRYKKEGSVFFRLVGESGCIRLKEGKMLDGLFSKNDEQKCAIDALIDPGINVVALSGPAGTGKTLLALAAGIHQTIKKSPLYEQVVVARPIVPMGNDLGYLPGDISEKLNPWMQPIFDNLEVIVTTSFKDRKDDTILNGKKYKNYQYLIDSGVLQVEPLTYIRGRSLPKRYFIIDEAQNLRPIDVKTIVTRCGDGTKIIFTGDIEQIDTPYLDSRSNGLSYLIAKFINQENFCYLNMRESVRSKLAEQGAKLL